MPIDTSIALMARETRVQYDTAPHSLDGEMLAEQSWQLVDDSFLLRAAGDHRFHYRKGSGVTVDRGAGAIVEDEALWLNGSVYAAIACLNGLLPVHASAVAHEGRVYASTGPSGAGKSTLIAGLGGLGLPMFCDDTLVFDLSDPDCVMCLPGHKRLKLTPDALALTGAEHEERVCADIDKFYARPPAGHVREPLPLACMVFLEEGPAPGFMPIAGAERIARLQDDHYTAKLFLTAHKFDNAELFAHLSRLARQIPMARFVRPRDPARFAEGIALAAEYVKRGART